MKPITASIADRNTSAITSVPELESKSAAKAIVKILVEASFAWEGADVDLDHWCHRNACTILQIIV